MFLLVLTRHTDMLVSFMANIDLLAARSNSIHFLSDKHEPLRLLTSPKIDVSREPSRQPWGAGAQTAAMLRGWTKANGRIMEERLIAAVADYPELYNSTLSSYKDADKKAKAWRAVSLQVELPEEDCRRKWKSLRDMFIKDKRSEQRRRASGGIHRSWKYSWQMAFLTPFIQSRTSQASAAMDELDEEREDDDKEEEKMEGGGNPSFVIHEIEGEHSEMEPPAGWQGPRRKRRWQVDGLEGAEDEMFLLSLVPYLKRLSYEKKSAIKLKFHQLLYEAEFQ